MAIMEIVEDGAPVLRQKAQPVTQVTKKVRKLIKDMMETMHAAEGVGLAAPQVVDVGDGPIALVNPEIQETVGTEIDVEGCLSVPGVFGYVERAQQVTVTGLDEAGQATKIKASDLFARALQHEIDHLDGILFLDKVLEVNIELEDEEA